MKEFEQFIEYRALAYKFESRNTLDKIMQGFETGSLQLIGDDGQPKLGSIEDVIPLQNVCAKLSVQLVERMESRLAVLSMSKRQFIEMAVISALEKIDDIFQMVDIHEFDQDRSEAVNAQGGDK